MDLGCTLLIVPLLAGVAWAEPPVPRTDLVQIPARTYTRCPLSHLAADREVAQIDTFYLEIDEVTQRQYDVCVRAGVCHKPLHHWPHPDQPVTGVSWYDADTYCRFIGRRLPGFAEWWRALYPPDPARRVDLPEAVSSLKEGALCAALVVHSTGQTVCDFYKTPSIVLRVRETLNEAEDAVWPPEDPRDVVNYPEGRILDMIGNVSEWVADWSPDRSRNEGWLTPRRDPRPRPGLYDRKMALGGDYLRMPIPSECGGTAFYEPTRRSEQVGFRCAADRREDADEHATGDGGAAAAPNAGMRPVPPALAVVPPAPAVDLPSRPRQSRLLGLGLLVAAFFVWRRRKP